MGTRINFPKFCPNGHVANEQGQCTEPGCEYSVEENDDE